MEVVCSDLISSDTPDKSAWKPSNISCMDARVVSQEVMEDWRARISGPAEWYAWQALRSA